MCAALLNNTVNHSWKVTEIFDICGGGLWFSNLSSLVKLEQTCESDLMNRGWNQYFGVHVILLSRKKTTSRWGFAENHLPPEITQTQTNNSSKNTSGLSLSSGDPASKTATPSPLSSLSNSSKRAHQCTVQRNCSCTVISLDHFTHTACWEGDSYARWWSVPPGQSEHLSEPHPSTLTTQSADD